MKCERSCQTDRFRSRHGYVDSGAALLLQDARSDLGQKDDDGAFQGTDDAERCSQ